MSPSLSKRFGGSEPATTRSRDEHPGFVSAAVDGGIGGLVATVVMTAYRLPIARSLPPTAAFWARYVGGGDPEDYPVIAVVLHLGYGIAAGTAFGVLYRASGASDRPEAEREVIGLALGVLYGAVLSVVGSRLILGRLLARDLARDEALVFHVGHVIYAVTLGTWVGSRLDRDGR